MRPTRANGALLAMGLSLATSLLRAPDAQASGFASQRYGGEHGSVLESNPTAVYYNPAGIALGGGGALGVYGTLAIRRLTWTHAAPSNQAGDEQFGNSGQANLLNVFGGPAIAGALRFGQLAVGAGFFAPFYGRAHWDRNGSLDPAKQTMYPLAADGVQRWFQVDAELSVLYYSVAAAYRLGPLSIGAAGNVIYSRVYTVRAQDPGGGPPNTTREARATLDVTGFHGSFAAGVMLEIVPGQLFVAASYQAQPAMGQQKLTGTLNVGDQPTEKVGFYQSLPDVGRAGVRWRMKSAHLEFRLFGDYTRWSVFLSQCMSIDQPKSYPCLVNSDGSDATGAGAGPLNLRRNWKDSYGGHLGVSYWARPRIELFFGAAYETAAVPDSTLTPELADADNVSGTLGARFQLTESFFVSGSYSHQQFANRDNTGKSTVAAVNGVPVRFPTRQFDGGGQYSQWIGTVTANVEALFP